MKKLSIDLPPFEEDLRSGIFRGFKAGRKRFALIGVPYKDAQLMLASKGRILNLPKIPVAVAWVVVI